MMMVSMRVRQSTRSELACRLRHRPDKPAPSRRHHRHPLVRREAPVAHQDGAATLQLRSHQAVQGRVAPHLVVRKPREGPEGEGEVCVAHGARQDVEQDARVFRLPRDVHEDPSQERRPGLVPSQALVQRKDVAHVGQHRGQHVPEDRLDRVHLRLRPRLQRDRDEPGPSLPDELAHLALEFQLRLQLPAAQPRHDAL